MYAAPSDTQLIVPYRPVQPRDLDQISESVKERLASEPIQHFFVYGNMIEKYGHQRPDQTAREKCWVAEISKWSYSPTAPFGRPAGP